MNRRLQGKTASVTGGARGIGRAIALALAQEGAAVAVNDLDGPGAQSTAAEIGGDAIALPGDIADLATHQTMVDRAIQAFGRADILVNNAGIEFHEPFLESSAETWDRTLAVNLKAPYFLAQYAARHMVATGLAGRILNVASIHDSIALRDRSIYAISKGGIRMLTRALAFELAGHGITVNAISPGAILTDMNRDALSQPEYRQAVLNKIPLARFGVPGDITGAAVFLVSSEATYITGATLYIDGGILVQ